MALRAVLLLGSVALAGPSLVARVPLPDPHVVRIGGGWTILGTGAKPFLLLDVNTSQSIDFFVPLMQALDHYINVCIDQE